MCAFCSEIVSNNAPLTLLLVSKTAEDWIVRGDESVLSGIRQFVDALRGNLVKLRGSKTVRVTFGEASVIRLGGPDRILIGVKDGGGK